MVASERIGKFANDKPIVGDLVIPHDAALAEEFVADEEDGALRVEDSTGAQDGPVAKKPRHESSSSAMKPIFVTAENIDQYSIYDVVLPLPGYDVVYPENDLKSRYQAVLDEDGVDFDSLLRATNSEYHLPGSFRHILKKPIQVTHVLKRYDDATIPLLETDVDRLEGKPLQASIPDAKLRALCLDFQLSTFFFFTTVCQPLAFMMLTILNLWLLVLGRFLVVRDHGCARTVEAEQQSRCADESEGRHGEQVDDDTGSYFLSYFVFVVS